MVCTYSWVTPYMKGLHNMIERWQYDQDSGCWKMKKGKHLQAILAERFQMSELCRVGTEGYKRNANPKFGLKGSSKGDLERILLEERLQSDV